MYENFLALPEEKQRRICDAALGAFGRHGYEKTSVEQIAKSAGIAKGMVFHYFGSKLGLFEYLAEYSERCLDGWFDGVAEEVYKLDYIEQYRRVTKIKLKAYTQQPRVFEFYSMLFMQPENLGVSQKVKSIFEGGMALRMGMLATLQNSQNTWLFREDLDREKAKKYVTWLIDGYAQHLLAVLGGQSLADVNLDGYWDEFDELLDDLKRLFYRPGG